MTRTFTPDEIAMAWRDGAPSKPWSEEWFIAITTYGDRVVLKALPEEYSYDFTTADHTYIKRDRIKKWMQFPDSDFVSPDEAANPIRESGPRPTGEPGANIAPKPAASGPVGRGFDNAGDLPGTGIK